jgi:hypothetical protein
MVIVNRARDPLLERIVAVKTILLDRDAGDRTECEARFLQEAVPTPPQDRHRPPDRPLGRCPLICDRRREGRAPQGAVRLPPPRAVEIAAPEMVAIC